MNAKMQSVRMRVAAVLSESLYACTRRVVRYCGAFIRPQAWAGNRGGNFENAVPDTFVNALTDAAVNTHTVRSIRSVAEPLLRLEAYWRF
jgi:hypothetical protein